jgi:antimicrobial peptide system SdpA family protein
MPTLQGDEQARRLRGFAFTGGLLWTIFLTAVLVQLPAGHAPGRMQTRRAIDTFWPQGWTFFAKVAQTDTIVVYRIADPGQVPRTATTPQMTESSLWGVSRANYAAVVESGEIASEVPTGFWTECRQATRAACWSAVLTAPPYRGVNPSPHPWFCGRLIIAVERPLARPPSRDYRQVARGIERAVAVDLTCH